MDSGKLTTWAMVAAGVVGAGVALYYLMDDGLDYNGK